MLRSGFYVNSNIIHSLQLLLVSSELESQASQQKIECKVVPEAAVPADYSELGSLYSPKIMTSLVQSQEFLNYLMTQTHPIQSQMLALSGPNRCSEAEAKLTELCVQTNGISVARTKLLPRCNYGSIKTGHVRTAVKDNQRNR